MLLTADRVWDGVASAPIERGFVQIDDGVIVGVGKLSDLGSDADLATAVELPADTTLLPGLIDCHQHLCFDGVGTLEEQVSGIDDAALTERARTAARRALAAGITTVRDLGDRGFLTLALHDDPTVPTILSAGPPITRVGGHCWYLGGECEGTDALRAAVRDRVERGCEVIKVMATGGGLTPTFPMWEAQFSDDEFAVIVDEAHAAGLPVAAHCHGLAGIVQALEAGADTIEHCSFMTAEGRAEPHDDVLVRIAASDVVVSATLGLVPGFVPPPFVVANRDIIFGMLHRLHELGATIVVGTDGGISAGKPHDILPTAVTELVGTGMSAVDGLRAVTSTAAQVCGVADRKGRIAAGYDADLLAVAGDPITTPGTVTNVTQVWRAGQAVR